MTNPTRQEIIEAYDALEKLCQRLPATRAAKESILRALPPKGSLFGRWATHETLGRGIITSTGLGRGHHVWFAYEEELDSKRTGSDFVHLDDLTLDPVELTTVEDFEGAPEGTVVTTPEENSYQKLYDEYWESVRDVLSNAQMAERGPWKILRWGWGE